MPSPHPSWSSVSPVPASGSRAVRFSLGTKLAVATVGVLAIASTLLFWGLTARERRGLVAAKTQAASMVADLFAATVAAPVDFVDTDPDSLKTEIQNLEGNPDVSCAAVWSEPRGDRLGTLDRGGCGSMVAPADAELGQAQVLLDRVEVVRSVKSPTNGRPIGRTRLVFSLARENAAYAASRTRNFALSFALAAAIAVLLIAISRRQIIAPILKLTRAARSVERGEFGGRIEIASRDEIGELAGAFTRMSGAIADREQRLEAARQELRDLFDHMRQAIFAFGRDGRLVGAASRQAATIFDRGALEGANVTELLYGGAGPTDLDAQAFSEWVSMAFEVQIEDWGEFAALAPREVILRKGRHDVPLELELRPVLKDGAIERIMVLATDVSEQRKLLHTVQTQEEEHARRMAAMRRLIAGGGQVFVQFMDAARERIERCIELVGPSPRMLLTGEIDELFRHVHTIKGEARAFDLRELEAEAAKLEEELDELRGLARGEGFVTTSGVHEGLLTRLKAAMAGIEKGAEVFVAASPIGRAALEQLTVQRPDVQELTAIADRLNDADLGRAVSRLAARPFGESTASLIDMAPTWGDREGKTVRLDVEGREVRVAPRLARVLGAVLTHLVRNAIAHGIEAPAVRQEAGKPACGTIHIEAKDQADMLPTIVLEDDGRGLDLDAIVENAEQLGGAAVDRTREDLANLVFLEGLTTAARGAQLAGRGVGLGAVRQDLERLGYAIEVTTKAGKGTRFTMTPRASSSA